MPSAENDVVQAERNDIKRHENWKLSIERENGKTQMRERGGAEEK